MSDHDLPVPLEQSTPPDAPLWRRPRFTILDVESGTVTTSGPKADGNGSTS